MKKLILCLFATMMFGFSGNAQATANAYTKSCMVIIATQAKSTFTKGQSYKDWLAAQTGSSATPTTQEDKFLKDVYGFLSAGANSETIYKNYDGASFIELAKLQKSGGMTVIGSSARCGFWCQLIIKLIGLILDDILIMP